MMQRSQGARESQNQRDYQRMSALLALHTSMFSTARWNCSDTSQLVFCGATLAQIAQEGAW